jgi:hypothetical protein
LQTIRGNLHIVGLRSIIAIHERGLYVNIRGPYANNRDPNQGVFAIIKGRFCKTSGAGLAEAEGHPLKPHAPPSSLCSPPAAPATGGRGEPAVLPRGRLAASLLLLLVALPACSMLPQGGGRTGDASVKDRSFRRFSQDSEIPRKHEPWPWP